MNITTKWKTIATVGFNGSVSKHQNPMAHGGVCHLQARKTNKGIIARKVNTNGMHEEIGESFLIDNEKLCHWISLGKNER
jgi:hypothetical protein